MREAYIIDAIRTPVGRRNGALAGVRADELAATTLSEIVSRTGIDPSELDDVVMGCVTQLHEQGVNVARNAALIAGDVFAQHNDTLVAFHFLMEGLINRFANRHFHH